MSLRRAAYGPSALATQPSLQRAALSTSASRAGAGGRQIWVSKPKEDRKSVFVGRAARLERGDEHEVQEILAEVTLDKRIAKSSHPTMHAWRFRDPLQPSAQLAQGKSDCGESGAGTVLSSLLDSTEATNVLLIVTRWYGGSPLGPSRFRHISSVGREALSLGGFLAPPPPSPDASPAKSGSKAQAKRGR